MEVNNTFDFKNNDQIIFKIKKIPVIINNWLSLTLNFVATLMSDANLKKNSIWFYYKFVFFSLNIISHYITLKEFL